MAKVNLKTRWWKRIDDNDYYYLSHKGFLIVKKRYEYIRPRLEKETNRVFYQLYRNQKVYLEELYKQIFNKEKIFDLKWYKKAFAFWKRERKKTLAKRKKKRQQKKREKFSNNTYLRRCHDCGKPTTNYRCDECWAKIRGVKQGRPSIDDDLGSFFDPDPDNIYTIHIPGGGFYG